MNDIKHLAKQALDGDKQCYKEFLIYSEKIVKKKYFSNVPQESLDEVTQEVLLAIHKSFHTLNPDISINSWIMAIARYKFVDHFRKFYKKQKFEDSSMSDIIPENNVVNPDDIIILNKYMNKLSSKERFILNKVKLQGHSFSETAKECNLTESNAKVIAFRALNKLKTIAVKDFANEK